MEYLRSISIIYSMSFLLVIFLMLYDLRFSRRKNIIISAAAMTPLIILTAVLFFVVGREKMSRLIYVTLSFPSLIFFLLMAKKPDSKFLVTFCFADTICFEIITLTSMLDVWLGGNKVILMFLARLIIFPALTFYIWKYIRKPYMELQKTVPKGWGLFAVVSVLYYGLLTYMVSFPTYITERPEDALPLLIIFAIMPLTYMAMFNALMGQKKLHSAEDKRINSDKQYETLQNVLVTEREYVERAKQHRHDMRHVVAIARDYISKGKLEEADKYLTEFDASISGNILKEYCGNSALNAMLRITTRRCMQDNVYCTIDVDIPGELPYTDIETGTLFGNLLENAYEAAKICREPWLQVHASVKNENLLMEIRNSVSGQVTFREDLPVTTKHGGGIGVKSAKQVMDKYNGMLRMRQEGDVFIAQIVQKL